VPACSENPAIAADNPGADASSTDGTVQSVSALRSVCGPIASYGELPPEIYEELKAGYKSSYAFCGKIDIAGLDHPKKKYDLTEALYLARMARDQGIGLMVGSLLATYACTVGITARNA
jgi:hypothetical protein